MTAPKMKRPSDSAPLIELLSKANAVAHQRDRSRRRKVSVTVCSARSASSSDRAMMVITTDASWTDRIRALRSSSRILVASTLT